MSRRLGVTRVYIATFFFALHFAIVLYVQSSFLLQFFSQGVVDLLFILDALLSILIFMYAPVILEKIGAKRLLVYALFLDYLSLMGLIGALSPTIVALSFILNGSMLLIIPYCLDIFLEAYTDEAQTGRVRGTNLTLGNLAICLSPLLVSIFVTGESLRLTYTASAIFLLPLLFIATTFKRLRTPLPGDNHSFSTLLRMWMHYKDIRRVTLVRYALEFFYSIMVIFVPVYLFEVIGFTWQELGVMFFIMLLPFVIFERVFGWLADCFYGEKEIMTTGLVIMAASTFIMPLLGPSFTAWTVVLFISRIGAAMVEIMCESYFFKQVSKDDTGLISIFRMMRPKSVVAAALFGGIALYLSGYSTVFYLLTVAMGLATVASTALKDTR